LELRKSAVGNRVRLPLERSVEGSLADVYEVSRILPTQEYRVKRVSDGQERAVGESQLVGVERQELAERPEIGAQQERQRIRNARASARSHALARQKVR
jgi:hypothetical protein